MVSVFSSKLKDLHAWNSCSHVFPTFKYLCLNKFCSSDQSTFMGSKEWYRNLASPNSVRQNLWTFTSLTKWCAFIQSFEWSRFASASSSGFSENSGLQFDQFICKCCFCGWSCGCWSSCCCCHCWFGAGTLSPLSACLSHVMFNLALNYNPLILFYHAIYFITLSTFISFTYHFLYLCLCFTLLSHLRVIFIKVFEGM